LLWFCFGFAWFCFGFALVLLGFALVLLWFCFGFAWFCFGTQHSPAMVRDTLKPATAQHKPAVAGDPLVIMRS
jgi:hypothetical protein